MPDDNLMKKSKIKECAFTIRMYFLFCFVLFSFLTKLRISYRKKAGFDIGIFAYPV